MKTIAMILFITAVLYSCALVQVQGFSSDEWSSDSSSDSYYPMPKQSRQQYGPQQQQRQYAPRTQQYTPRTKQYTPRTQQYTPRKQQPRPIKHQPRPIKQQPRPIKQQRHPRKQQPRSRPVYKAPQPRTPVYKAPQPRTPVYAPPQPYPGQYYAYQAHPAQARPTQGYGQSLTNGTPEKCTIQKECACESYFKVNSMEASFFDHEVMAIHEGCFLATASDQKDLKLILKAARALRNTVLSNSLAYIGLARYSQVSEESAENGDKDGPWKWTDGCTKYKRNVFTGNNPNGGGIDNQTVAAIAYDIVSGDAHPVGSVLDVLAEDKLRPAVYECCRKKKQPHVY